MKGNLATIVTSLRRIQEEGGNNAVIFASGANENYYIQFAGDKGEIRLYAEAVSNECLPPDFALNENQIRRLQSMGWNHPSQGGTPNFFREWQATNDQQRLTIAHEVMRAFVEVYGATPHQPLIVDLMLDGAHIDAHPFSYLDSGTPQPIDYPPRVLAPGYSFWLAQGAYVELIRHNLVACRTGKTCYLAQPPEATADVLVNGQPLIGKRVLRDGDFMHSGKHRFIFQADPVADRRSRMEGTSWQPKLNNYLSQRVRGNSRGLSLDGGKTSARWEDIIALFVSPPYGKGGISVGALTWGGQRLGQVDRLSVFSVRQLFQWLGTLAPFDLSVQHPYRWGRLVPPDAYTLAATKLLYRVEAGQIILPVKRRFVLGEPLRFQRLRQSLVTLLGSIAFCLITMMLLGKTLENQRVSQLIDEAGALTVGGIIAALMLGSFLFASVVGMLYGLTELIRTLTAPSRG